MNYCPQCRSALDPGARFCANCGHTLPAQAPAAQPGPRPFAGQPAPYGTPPPVQGYGPPAGPPPSPYGAPPAAPPGYGGGAPGGYGPPGMPPAAPPGMVPVPAVPAADPGSGMKVLGGCGVAGCIGVVVAALLCGVLLFVLIFAGGSSSSSGGGGSSSGGGSTEVPSSGSARDLIRQQVGEYTLVGTSPLDKVPPGVIDSVGAVYSAHDGTRVFHVILIYPTESIARDRIENVWRTAISEAKPGERVGRTNLTDSQGTVKGTLVSSTNVTPESFYWNNRKLVGIISAAAPHAKGFELSVPY